VLAASAGATCFRHALRRGSMASRVQRARPGSPAGRAAAARASPALAGTLGQIDAMIARAMRILLDHALTADTSIDAPTCSVVALTIAGYAGRRRRSPSGCRTWPCAPGRAIQTPSPRPSSMPRAPASTALTGLRAGVRALAEPRCRPLVAAHAIASSTTPSGGGGRGASRARDGRRRAGREGGAAMAARLATRRGAGRNAGPDRRDDPTRDSDPARSAPAANTSIGASTRTVFASTSIGDAGGRRGSPSGAAWPCAAGRAIRTRRPAVIDAARVVLARLDALRAGVRAPIRVRAEAAVPDADRRARDRQLGDAEWQPWSAMRREFGAITEPGSSCEAFTAANSVVSPRPSPAGQRAGASTGWPGRSPGGGARRYFWRIANSRTSAKRRRYSRSSASSACILGRMARTLCFGRASSSRMSSTICERSWCGLPRKDLAACSAT
jgi:hypothetical protein